MGSIPDQGKKIPHAMGQLSPWAITTEPAWSRTCVPQLERAHTTNKDLVPPKINKHFFEKWKFSKPMSPGRLMSKGRREYVHSRNSLQNQRWSGSPLFVSWDLPLRLLGCLGHWNAMICEQMGRDTSAIYVFEIFPFCLSLQLSLGF